MGVPARSRQYLVDNEGLAFVHDLIYFKGSNTWRQITDNMRRPPMIPDPANMAGPMIHQAAFTLSAKSLNRLVIAAVAVSYYGNTDRTLDAAIMMYDSRL